MGRRTSSPPNTREHPELPLQRVEINPQLVEGQHKPRYRHLELPPLPAQQLLLGHRYHRRHSLCQQSRGKKPPYTDAFHSSANPNIGPCRRRPFGGFRDRATASQSETSERAAQGLQQGDQLPPGWDTAAGLEPAYRGFALRRKTNSVQFLAEVDPADTACLAKRSERLRNGVPNIAPVRRLAHAPALRNPRTNFDVSCPSGHRTRLGGEVAEVD